MSLRTLAGGVICCLALLSAGCSTCGHAGKHCGRAAPAAPCCPPGTGPAVVPAAPPGYPPPGYPPPGYTPAYYRH